MIQLLFCCLHYFNIVDVVDFVEFVDFVDIVVDVVVVVVVKVRELARFRMDDYRDDHCQLRRHGIGRQAASGGQDHPLHKNGKKNLKRLKKIFRKLEKLLKICRAILKSGLNHKNGKKSFFKVL